MNPLKTYIDPWDASQLITMICFLKISCFLDMFEKQKILTRDPGGYRVQTYQSLENLLCGEVIILIQLGHLLTY